ncbi:hypothetical protein [Peribacillus sp. SCS-155]|uniref:hypothetical protein n=1 Tax=Peribacillus sedimenti TaxID=3115297 RepID=UPI0039066439
MHFRQFILSAILIGGAILLPNLAFAAKPGEKPLPKDVQAEQVTEKAKKADIPVPAGKEPKSFSNNKQQKMKEKVQPTLMDLKKSAAKNPAKPAQGSKAQVDSSTKQKKILPPKGKQIKKATTHKSNTSGPQPKVHTPKAQEKTNPPIVEAQTKKISAVNSVQKSRERNTPKKLTKPLESREHVRVSSQLPDSVSEAVTNKTYRKQSKPHYVKKLVSTQFQPGAGKGKPADKEIPGSTKAINTGQTNHNTASSSKERKKFEPGKLLFTDKVFKWDQQLILGFNQLHNSRFQEFSNQWTNAPPSKPPQTLLVF